jgi:hypothetical protein
MALIVGLPIAVTSGGFTAISATTFSRYVEIEEDGSGPPAGIVVEMPAVAAASAGGGIIPDGNPFTLTPGEQPLRFGNPGGGAGPLVGNPGGGPYSIPATVYCFVKSVGATSKIQVRETN